MALAAALTLGACKATGGGYIGMPTDGGPVSVFSGRANYGFTFTCEMRGDQAQIKGQITYHDSSSTIGGKKFPEIRLHGVVDPFFVDVPTCEAAAEAMPNAAQFDGTYRSQDTTLSAVPPGRFTVLVFDQGEPGRSVGEITGDGFSIELLGGAYAAYTRAGYIEGGNIQVEG
jgi:hypothetical protein